MSAHRKALLMILDGWGIGKGDNSDAIFCARTPFMDEMMSGNNVSRLKTFGENVGLPQGQMGNSEVGHLNIGAGRVVYQMLVRINQAIERKRLIELPAFKNTLDYLRSSDANLHLFGLISDGGVHASTGHLLGLCRVLKDEGLDHRVKIHAFMDGRDTDPHSGISYLKEVIESNDLGRAEVVSAIGRYYAMDRDKRWERVAKAYHLLTSGQGTPVSDLTDGIRANYDNGITDEFMEPLVKVDENGKALATIQNGDAAMCFNFRTDRGREITMALSQQAFEEYNMRPLDLHYVTMTEYDKTFRNVDVLFHTEDIRNTLGEYLADRGLTQLRAAETEKYPHVTFFFSGGREEPFTNEERVLIPSPKVATYDLRPEMSALPLTDAILDTLKADQPDFICLNFANPDMVGHTGVFSAIVKACETVDSCAQRITAKAREMGYSVVIIADHGNADFAVNADGSPNTAHSTNLVPCVILGDEDIHAGDGILADIAPTILKLMQLPQPEEMTGRPLY